MNRFRDLDHFLHQSWDLLFRAAHSRNDPMRTPMMATYDGLKCHLRTIVLRKVDRSAHQLLFFTDCRSPKVNHLEHHPNTAITFWNPRRKVQLRIKGVASLEQGSEEARRYWEHLSIAGRESYATLLPPGTASVEDSTGLPEHWSKDMEKAETDDAFENFMLIYVTVKEIDALHLHPEGHQRARFIQEGEEWKKNWLIP